MTVYVAPVSSGLGDLIVSLPVVQQLIADGEETVLVCRSIRQDGVGARIEGLASEIREEDFSIEMVGPNDRLINLREHPLQKDHIWGSREFEAQFGPIKIMQIVEMLSHGLGVEADFKQLKPLVFNRVPQLKERIALIAGTDGFCKHWPTEHWLALQEILSKQGVETFLIGLPDQSPPVKELIDLGLTWFPTATIGDAIDAVSSCLAVVSVDTGLMHIAVHQGTPTVAFFNRAGLYRRSEPNCAALTTIECADECKQEFPLDPNMRKTRFSYEDNKTDERLCRMSVAESCMYSVSPQSVVDSLDRLNVLSRTKTLHAKGASHHG